MKKFGQRIVDLGRTVTKGDSKSGRKTSHPDQSQTGIAGEPSDKLKKYRLQAYGKPESGKLVAGDHSERVYPSAKENPFSSDTNLSSSLARIPEGCDPEYHYDLTLQFWDSTREGFGADFEQLLEEFEESHPDINVNHPDRSSFYFQPKISPQHIEPVKAMIANLKQGSPFYQGIDVDLRKEHSASFERLDSWLHSTFWKWAEDSNKLPKKLKEELAKAHEEMISRPLVSGIQKRREPAEGEEG